MGVLAVLSVVGVVVGDDVGVVAALAEATVSLSVSPSQTMPDMHLLVRFSRARPDSCHMVDLTCEY